tara:strand:- start:837 stop:2258 length:1422 start_codon:yes stop_codon:yes gene_type:complete
MIKDVSFTKKKSILISIALGLIFFLVSYDFGMFWDNVLFASKMGNQLYYNDLFNWTMPDSFDPGHPPFLGFLLAITWKIFGHSLWISHLTMLPFVIAIIYQLHRFVNYYTKNNISSYLGLLLILVDPTLMTSFVLVNPETIILFFFFLAVNGILYDNKRWKFIGFLFLSIITFRSMMLFAGLFIFDILNHSIIQKKKIKKSLNLHFLGFYFLTALPGIIFVIWRLATKGWLQTHVNSPWASLWKFPSLTEFSKNIAVLIWRYLDFGRIFIFIFLIFALWSFRKKIAKKKSIQQLLLLAFCSVIFVMIAVLLSTNAFGHRYFIASYICFILVAFLIILELKKYKKIIYTLLISGLITGNLWIYPEKISQGWDATLAHIPYHGLRKDAIQFLDTKKINFKQVATFFPNYDVVDDIDLTGDFRSFSHFNKKNNYVLYSNVYNLTDEEYDSLDKNYIEIKRFHKLHIYVSIYQSKEN